MKVLISLVISENQGLEELGAQSPWQKDLKVVSSKSSI